MDTFVSCFCGTHRADPQDSDFVLNDIPICNRACLEKAEKSLGKKDTLQVRRRREAEFNGA